MKRFVAALALVGLTGCVYTSTQRPHPMSPAETRQESGDVVVVRKSERAHHTKVATSLKVSLGAAIETALGKVKGQALGATTELENGKPVIEVQILSDGKLWEVEIDGTTGDVLEVEQEDDDDDEDDDDMEDDD